MADGGYVKLFRQINEWRYWDRPVYTQVWMHLLVRVDWKPGWKFGEPVGPGETIITLRSFAEECGISKDTLSRVLHDLEAEKQIELSLRQGKTFIKVLNYAVFQGSEGSPRDKYQTQNRTPIRTETRTENRTPSIYRRNKEIKNKRIEEPEDDHVLTAEELKKLNEEIENSEWETLKQ